MTQRFTGRAGVFGDVRTLEADEGYVWLPGLAGRCLGPHRSKNIHGCFRLPQNGSVRWFRASAAIRLPE
jgi:hypothetical protein